MSDFERKIVGFSRRNGFDFKWEELQFNGKRAVFKSHSIEEHDAISHAARRLRGVKASDKVCWSPRARIGYVYLQDAEDARRVEEASAERIKLIDAWWEANHRARLSGLDPDAAAQYAESLYPTSAMA